MDEDEKLGEFLDKQLLDKLNKSIKTSNNKRPKRLPFIKKDIRMMRDYVKEVSVFNAKDRVLVNYQTKWFNLVNVEAVILRAERSGGYPFQLRLETADGKPCNLGHDDDGGAPGSGPYMYCRDDNLTMVTKYVSKRLEGTIKTDWKEGDRFIPKKGISIDQDDDQCNTGITEDMLTKCAGVEMTIRAIITRCNVDWLQDGTENFMWLSEWIDPVE